MVEGNLVYLNGGSGISVNGSGIIVRGNDVWDNGQMTNSPNISVNSGNNTLIEHNRIRTTTTTLTEKPAYGLYIETGLTGIVVRNNEIQAGSGTSVDYSNHSTDTMLIDLKQIVLIDSATGDVRTLTIENGVVTIV